MKDSDEGPESKEGSPGYGMGGIQERIGFMDKNGVET